MRILVAPVLAVLVSPIVAPAAPATSQPPTLQGLFEQTLEAKGDAYIELRSQITPRKDAASFLKTRLADKNCNNAATEPHQPERSTYAA